MGFSNPSSILIVSFVQKDLEVKNLFISVSFVKRTYVFELLKRGLRQTLPVNVYV